MCKITKEQDVHVKLYLLIEAPISHAGTQILKISHQNGGQNLSSNLVCEPRVWKLFEKNSVVVMEWQSDIFFCCRNSAHFQICHKENVFLNASLDLKYSRYIVHTPQGLQGAKKVSFSVASTH